MTVELISDRLKAQAHRLRHADEISPPEKPFLADARLQNIFLPRQLHNQSRSEKVNGIYELDVDRGEVIQLHSKLLSIVLLNAVNL